MIVKWQGVRDSSKLQPTQQLPFRIRVDFTCSFYSLYTPCTEPSLRSPPPLHLPSDSSADPRPDIPAAYTPRSFAELRYIMCHAVYRHVPRNPPSHPCTNPFALLSTHSL